MTKRAIQVLREMQGDDIKNIKCLYCMDTGWCRICSGVGRLPANVNGRLSSILCWKCNGDKKCPDCGGKKKSA